MVRCKVGFVSLLVMIFLAGCGNKEIHVTQEVEMWNHTDVEISRLPENAFVYEIVPNGVYYRLELSENYSKEETTVENEFHFLDYSGNDKMLLRKSEMNTYMTECDGNNMILCNVNEVGMEVLELSPEGVKTLFNQNAPQFPFIQSYEQYMVSIRNNFAEDRSMYENALVLRETEQGKERVIYRALWDNERGIGEDLGCVSVNDKSICFTLNRYYESGENEYILMLYNIEKGVIEQEIPLPTRVCYAAYGGEGDGLLLSETDDYTYIEEAGVIGYIKDGIFVEQTKIPMISASNIIRDGSYTAGGYYFITYNAAYYWDIESQIIHLYDYLWCENTKFRSRIMPTREGLKYVFEDGDSTFVRTLSVKKY